MVERCVQTLCFEEPGPQNTTETLAAAIQRADALSIKHVVVASDTGKTGRLVLDSFGRSREVVVVTNPRGLALPVARLHDYLPRFREYKESLVARGIKSVPVSMSDQAMAELEQSGAVVTRLDWRKLQAFVKGGMGALDKVGIGVRVAFTVSVWAMIAGAVPPDVELIALAGTGFGGGGADTALVVRTAQAWRDVRILEILARPRVSPPSEMPG